MGKAIEEAHNHTEGVSLRQQQEGFPKIEKTIKKQASGSV
jgi:hypothetical protein